MLNQALNSFDRAKGTLANDFRTMIADSEELLKATAAVSGEGLAVARTKFEQKLKSAKTTLAEASEPLLDKTRNSAAAAEDYVSENPWTAVGVAVAAGALIGFLAAKR